MGITIYAWKITRSPAVSEWNILYCSISYIYIGKNFSICMHNKDQDYWKRLQIFKLVAIGYGVPISFTNICLGICLNDRRMHN